MLLSSRRIKPMCIPRRKHSEERGNRHKSRFASKHRLEGKVIMESSSLKLIDGTAALSVSEQVEEEFAKDRWDAHNIPGLRYAPHRTTYHIDFQLIPGVFRPMVKEFMKFKIATGVATSTLIRGTYCLRNFLLFFSKLYPCTSTLQMLSKQDMDAFILDFKSQASSRGLKDVNQH